MGSRLKTDPDHLYECFFEVAGPSDETPGPHIVNTFPDTFKDDVVAKELPRFCFPCDLSRYNPAGQLFTFVLTGMDNLQRFGFCRHPPGAKTAICFLSYLPWFDIFYKVLNKLASLKSSCEPAADALLEQLYQLAVPSPGKQLRITVNDGSSTSEMLHTCPDTTSTLPSIPENINMTEYFSAITPENMIILFASLLHERRVLITSDRLHRLTACVHGAVSMLYPLHWQHIYIPVTPSHLIDYCSAPMPFLIGVHASFMEQVRRMALDEVVILDADNNSIETPFDDLQSLPSEAVNQLKHNLKNSSQVSGDGMARSFLKTIVCLLGSYKEALQLEDGSGQIVFDRDQFIANGSKHEMSFRNNVLQLQHFTQFVESRVTALNEDRIIDDLFEEELDSRIASGSSKLQEGIKRKLQQAKAKSTVFYGKIKDKSRDAKDKVTVNPQAVKDAFNQTKHFANKRITTMKDKLRFRENEDILSSPKPEISPPLSGARSTPSSPTGSPVSRRKLAAAQSKDRSSDKSARGTRHYDVLEIDGNEELSLEEALRDGALLPARYSSLSLMPAVQPFINQLRASSDNADDADSKSQGSSGESASSTPQPPARRKRERKNQEDAVSLRSNHSSTGSLTARTDAVSSSSDTSAGGGVQHNASTRSRPRGNPPPPPPPTYVRHLSTNNSNQGNLIDISSVDSPDKGEVVGQFEDNFQPLVTMNPASAGALERTKEAAKRKTSGTLLLEEYGLFFNTLDISHPTSLPTASQSMPAKGPPRPDRPPSTSGPSLVKNHSGLADLLSGPLLTSTSAPSEAAAMPVARSGNPFVAAEPTVPHPAPSGGTKNPFQAPLTPTKKTSGQASLDPFADLVSMQKTNLSPINKESPASLTGNSQS